MLGRRDGLRAENLQRDQDAPGAADQNGAEDAPSAALSRRSEVRRLVFVENVGLGFLAKARKKRHDARDQLAERRRAETRRRARQRRKRARDSKTELRRHARKRGSNLRRQRRFARKFREFHAE